MSHGITEIDKGYVWGTTWHNVPSYKQLTVPVTIEQAEEVMNYPMEKNQLFRKSEGSFEAVDAWCIRRTDTNTIVSDAVGARFNVLNNVHLLHFIDKSVIRQYPQLVIESVGTLFGGAISFLNLKASSFTIKGDDSETVNRLMYYNPIGMGSYQAGAHSVRVVCNNTLRMASAESEANQTLKRFKHTGDIKGKISEHLINLSKFFLELKSREEILTDLSTKAVDTEFINTFIDKLFPAPKEEGRSATIAQNRKNSILEVFESDQNLQAPVNRSRYAVLQSVTYWADHKSSVRGGDDGARMWDGIVGNRAVIKDRALELLTTI